MIFRRPSRASRVASSAAGLSKDWVDSVDSVDSIDSVAHRHLITVAGNPPGVMPKIVIVV
ncbi:MAG TPA: hypothetical protein DCL19_05040 [Gammaproteobacteria bacterium]|nr:hypothetical protein [Gammaproteobacteria bacterium]